MGYTKEFHGAANEKRVLEFFQEMEERFTSNNDVPVTRASITREDWELLRTFVLAQYRSRFDV